MRTALLLVALAGCAHDTPLRTTGVHAARVFWCAATGECFADALQCGRVGQCLETHSVWCSMHGDNGVCAATVDKCRELAIASEEYDLACEEAP